MVLVNLYYFTMSMSTNPHLALDSSMLKLYLYWSAAVLISSSHSFINASLCLFATAGWQISVEVATSSPWLVSEFSKQTTRSYPYSRYYTHCSIFYIIFHVILKIKMIFIKKTGVCWSLMLDVFLRVLTIYSLFLQLFARF